MITIHELGHYIAGKILKFRINEFSIGFGPALFKRQNKKTGEIFAIRAIPLGGYCAFDGEDDAGSGGHKAGRDSGSNNGQTDEGRRNALANLDSTDDGGDAYHTADGQPRFPKRTGGSFESMHPWKRLVVLFSGAFANFLSAIVFSIILLMIVGYNQGVYVGRIVDDSPNFGILQDGDIIRSIDGEEFRILRPFAAVMQSFEFGTDENGNAITQIPVVFGVERDGQMIEGGIAGYVYQELDPASGQNLIMIGIQYASVTFIPMGFFPAIGQGVLFTFDLVWLILTFLGMLFTGGLAVDDMAGPIGTVTVISQSVSSSFIHIFLLLPLISVNLAVFNLLPIPALDGARMIFIGVEWIRGKPINPNIEGRIHMIGLITLMALVLLLDVNFLFGGARGMLEMFGHWRL